jgi:hypothetical protein
MLSWCKQRHSWQVLMQVFLRHRSNRVQLVSEGWWWVLWNPAGTEKSG